LASTRVYILARELGVKSSAIVRKCREENLDVRNHMSTISAGLAATIREWFSEGDNVTTVEIAEKVNLEKVRTKTRPKRTPPARQVEQTLETESEQLQPSAAQAVAEAPAEQPAQAPAASLGDQQQAVGVVGERTEAQEEIEPAEQAEETEESVQTTAAAVEESTARPEVAKRKPEPIRPAGPMLEKPEPAQLSGPNVVRVESPEPERPRKRKPSRPRRDKALTKPLTGERPALEKPGIAAVGKQRPNIKADKGKSRGGRRDRWFDRAEQKTKSPTGRWRQRDIEERQARLEAASGEGLRLRPKRKISSKLSSETVRTAKPKKVTISQPITVRDLSAALAAKTKDIIARLMRQGVMVTANQTVNADVAGIVALDFGTELVVEEKKTLEEQIRAEFEQRPRNHLERRTVVATMLGHVDHGKTSLLDKIRSTDVTSSEAGGITQHIGAYQVNFGDDKVTFLDTPGHEAFTAMRARGANMTDVVVLVVAADDGVMPQTVEAIRHTRAAKVPIIVAMNKIDLPGCDINRIYAQLAEHDLTPVAWGGQTEVVHTSAITGTGIEDLLEHLQYVAELLELKADDTIAATGWVVEAKMSPQQGPVATLLIEEGRLRKADVVLAGTSYGRVKVIRDSFGKKICTATSTMPVEITGLSSVPQAGDRFYCLDDINRAKSAAEQNESVARRRSLGERSQVTLENLFSEIEAGNVKELNIIIRADVQGSVDVLTKYLGDLSTDEVKIKILHAAPGGITEGDVVLAEASNAIIIGFNVVSEEQAARMAETRGVEIRLYNVIYRITEDLQKSMVGLLEPEEQEKSLGRATVKNTFKISKLGTIAGCYVVDGLVKKNAKVRLIRDNVVIRNDLQIDSLKRFKNDARQVKAGLECGIKMVRFDDVKVDDVLDFYEVVKVARTL